MFALGDAAGVRAESFGGVEQLPSTAQVAFQQADYAAWNVWAAINGKPLLPFRYQVRVLRVTEIRVAWHQHARAGACAAAAAWGGMSASAPG